MRVVLIGTPRARARLRRALIAGIEVAGEAASLGEARAGHPDVDAFLLAPREPEDQAVAAEEPPVVEETLTPREMEVVELLAEGLPNKAIAVRLHISDQTVKFHVAAICGKLGAINRTDAVRRAVRRGIIVL